MALVVKDTNRWQLTYERGATGQATLTGTQGFSVAPKVSSVDLTQTCLSGEALWHDGSYATAANATNLLVADKDVAIFEFFAVK